MPKMNKMKILHIEDDKVDRMAFEKFVKKGNLRYDLTISVSVEEARKALKNNEFDIVLSDYQLGDGTVMDIMDLTNKTPVIIVTGEGDEKIAVKALKEGASDYLVKDAESKYLNILPITIENALIKKKAEEKHIQSEKLEAIIEFACAACHELSQPLTIISCYSNLLQGKDTTDESLKKTLAIIQEQVERMAKVIHKFQNINQYKTKKYIDRRIVDIDKSSGAED
ncbi:response regulator [candidate division KSB1 bacterium]|nr:response regulator [candidate division KSB1 bacterium]